MMGSPNRMRFLGGSLSGLKSGWYLTRASLMSNLEADGLRMVRSLTDGRWIPLAKVTNWKGELPERSFGAGRTRVASPYDDVVKSSFDEKQPKLVAGVGEPGSDERKEHLKQIRRAAEFHDVGLDVYPDQPEGIVFVAREKRPSTRKGASSAA